MSQIECPSCGAPMWEGGRCPWDRGEGCSVRLRSRNELRAKAATQANERLKTQSAPRPASQVVVARRVSVNHSGTRDHIATGRKSHEVEWENRTTCKARRHQKPPYGVRCQPCKSEAVRELRARRQTAVA
jgi:hypothetical protein